MKLYKRVVCVTVFTVTLLAGCRQNRGMMTANSGATSGRDAARQLMVAYAKHADSDDASHRDFDNENDRSFGDFGFHYYPSEDALEGRVLIIRTHLHDWPEANGPTQRNAAALNDPTIGGMYDSAGGHFVLDEKKDMLFLVKRYPVASTSADQFERDFDNVRSIAGVWLTEWLPIVTEQASGARPNPTQRIDRMNDPYARH